MQGFPYVASVTLGKNNLIRAMIGDTPTSERRGSVSLELNVKSDFVPLGFSTNGGVENAGATFVGYGITAKDLKYDDYAGIDVKSRIVVAFAAVPDADSPHGQFAQYADVRWRAVAARNAGAMALVVIAKEDKFGDDRLSVMRYDNSGGDAGLPVLVISRQAAGNLLKAGGLGTLAELEKTLNDRRAEKNAEGLAKNASAHLGGLNLTVSVDVVKQNAPSANVIGVLDGSDPTLKKQYIVLGAHYDHLGKGGAGSLAQREGDIHHGADDNASGTAGLLELARMLSSDRNRPQRSIVFIAFSGEEEGLLGSNYYVNHPAFPLAQTVAMINMDMIGRMKNRNLIIGGVGTATEWKDWISAANDASGMTVTPNAASSRKPTGMPIVTGTNGRTVVSSDPSKRFDVTLNEDGYGPSDHSSFYSKKIPVLFFWTGTHLDYHKPSDTADKIEYGAEARIIGFVAQLIRSVDAGKQRPTYTVAKSESQGRSTGFGVYLGTIPTYVDSNDGLKLDGVREDSPASKAGLKAGDVIVKIASREIRNVYDYTAALGEMKAGQEYEVEAMRGNERLKFKITPTARK
jgi:hypothetical protein